MENETPRGINTHLHFLSSRSKHIISFRNAQSEIIHYSASTFVFVCYNTMVFIDWTPGENGSSALSSMALRVFRSLYLPTI